MSYAVFAVIGLAFLWYLERRDPKRVIRSVRLEDGCVWAERSYGNVGVRVVSDRPQGGATQGDG